MIAAEKIKKRERDASLRDLWRTPQWLFVAIQRYIGVKFDVDVACNKDNALLPNFIGVERDALKCSWGDPIEIVMLARHFGEAYLEEKERADKLQATLEMVSKPKCSPDSVKADETNASKDREIAGLKSSLAMLLAAFKLMSSQAGFKMLGERHYVDPVHFEN